MDLVRQILFTAEQGDEGYVTDRELSGSWDDHTVAHHVWLMWKAGLVDAIDVTHNGSKGPEASLQTILPAGHDFIELARNEKVWKTAMTKVSKAGGGMTIGVLTALLTELVKSSVLKE